MASVRHFTKFALDKIKQDFDSLSDTVKEYEHSKVLESYINRALKEDFNYDKQRLLSTFFGIMIN